MKPFNRIYFQNDIKYDNNTNFIEAGADVIILLYTLTDQGLVTNKSSKFRSVSTADINKQSIVYITQVCHVS